jgi:hypothetical protein
VVDPAGHDRGNRLNEAFFGYALQAARAETGNPSLDKHSPEARQRAKILYGHAWDLRYGERS